MATQSKSQFLNDIHTHLKRKYKPKPDRHAGKLSVLEAVIYGICHEDTTREQANQALSRFKDQFFDWNEVRVSPIAEIQETLAGIPNAEARAQRIRRFLRQLFEKTYGFSLDALSKKPLKEALKVLAAYEAFTSDYVTATVIQQALGGHAIPVDGSARRALERLGIADPDLSALRSVLERAIPKNRGLEFFELLEELAHDTCLPGEPECPRCDLRKICHYAQTKKQQATSRQTASRAPAKAAPPPAKPAEKAPKKAPSPPPAAARSKPAPAPAPKKAAPKTPPPPPPKSPPGKRGSK